jgi:hypothetical protein
MTAHVAAQTRMMATGIKWTILRFFDPPLQGEMKKVPRPLQGECYCVSAHEIPSVDLLAAACQFQDKLFALLKARIEWQACFVPQAVLSCAVVQTAFTNACWTTSTRRDRIPY